MISPPRGTTHRGVISGTGFSLTKVGAGGVTADQPLACPAT